MNKKIMILAIVLIFILFLCGFIWNSASNVSKEENIYEMNKIDVSYDEDIFDECTDEWIEYNSKLQDAFEEASSQIDENQTHYTLRCEEGFIVIYYINENGEETLYRKTDICTDYLSKDDIDSLDNGIEVIGNSELNKLLEDFE